MVTFREIAPELKKVQEQRLRLESEKSGGLARIRLCGTGRLLDRADGETTDRHR